MWLKLIHVCLIHYPAAKLQSLLIFVKVCICSVHIHTCDLWRCTIERCLLEIFKSHLFI